MNGWLAFVVLLGPPIHPARSCSNPADFATHPPQELRRALNGAYDPETLRVFHGIPGQRTVCPPNQVSSSTPCAIHLVYKPASGQEVRDPLVVFLPGTGMEAERHNQVLQTAAYAGYRTIGLSYDNVGTMESFCQAEGDCADCYGEARDEIITGNDTRPNVTIVERSDSIVERLHNLLDALEADDLADGVDDDQWGDFYEPFAVLTPPPNSVAIHTLGSINWDRIILAGFSQGAGHAARIAQKAQVHGLIILDGGNDTCGVDQPASWYADDNASLGRPRYGVTHRRGVANWSVPATWLALGFPAGFHDFEDNVISLEPAAVGITAQRIFPPPPNPPETPNTPCNAHYSMAKDGCMPTAPTGGDVAATADDAYLFARYLTRFCYACDPLTCP